MKGHFGFWAQKLIVLSLAILLEERGNQKITKFISGFVFGLALNPVPACRRQPL